MMKKFNPFHLVEVSPWPILASSGALVLVLSNLLLLNTKSFYLPTVSLMIMLLISHSWWRDIHRESSNQGSHSFMVMNGLKTGMILFITSEVFFFLSFFWAFFHSSISPTVELGQMWPPMSISPFNPMGTPLLNTILLLSSGVSITWSHHEMLKSNYKKTKIALSLTICLGVVFSMLQGFEYGEASFSMADSTFGATFFMATGFHGLHVIIGSIFLAVSLARLKSFINSPQHSIGFECAAWYWHFVDVVWLFLYSMLYWWGA